MSLQVLFPLKYCNFGHYILVVEVPIPPTCFSVILINFFTLGVIFKNILSLAIFAIAVIEVPSFIVFTVASDVVVFSVIVVSIFSI